jgi:16S rRNA (uracil1498-N3)-methyltransferase
LCASGRPKGKRLFVAASRWGAEILLGQEEKHYLLDVHRLTEGAPVEIFDGAGRNARARLFRRPAGWVLEPVELGSGGVPPPPVRLGVALTRGRKLDEVVRMVTEIGVRAIEPFYARRSVARPSEAEAEKRRLRWQKIATQAARQSGQSWVPEIRQAVSFEQILARRGEARGLLLHPAAPAGWRAPAGAQQEETFVLVGPEGGFSPEECREALESGFIPLALKLPVLRADTAAVVAAALACLDYYEKLG